MSKTILANVNGWTPLIDTIVDSEGIMIASVFGRMWRYCQMEDGVCTASQSTIAKELGVSRMTVFRHISKLCEDKYLEDMTPNIKNKPHIYKDTGKAELRILINAVSKSDSAVTNSDSPTVTNSSLKRAIKKELNKELNCATAPDKEILMLDLLFINIQHGYSLSEQIVKYNDAQGRKSTNKFASPQQKEAFEKVIAQLNSSFETVMIDAISKRGASREKILAYCQMYIKNESDKPQHRKESHAKLDTGNTVSDEGREFAERLTRRSQATV